MRLAAAQPHARLSRRTKPGEGRGGGLCTRPRWLFRASPTWTARPHSVTRSKPVRRRSPRVRQCSSTSTRARCDHRNAAHARPALKSLYALYRTVMRRASASICALQIPSARQPDFQVPSQDGHAAMFPLRDLRCQLKRTSTKPRSHARCNPDTSCVPRAETIARASAIAAGRGSAAGSPTACPHP